MRTNIRSTILALALIVPASGAWTIANEQIDLQPQSRLWIDGTSTVRSFTCKANEVNAVVEGNGANAISAVLTGEKGVKAVRVTIPAAQIDCGNGTMNEHMRKAIKLGESPSIDFRLANYDVARSGEGVVGKIAGTLSLGGVEKSISLNAEGKAEGGMLHVTGSYPLKMTEYGLKPPTLMFGRIKVGETVTVKFDLVLKE